MGTLGNMLITLGLFSIVVLGLIGFTGDMGTNYGVTHTDLTYLNKTQELNTKMIEIQQTMNKTDSSAVQKTEAFFTGAYQVLMLIPESLNIFGMIMFESADLLGLPEWVVPSALVVLSIVIIVGIISAIQKFRV